MFYSKLFGKAQKTPPKDADSVNARLLIQAGFIEKLAAGIYIFLPLGYRVLSKINKIIEEEIDVVLGQEIFMPVLHPRELWIKTGRDAAMNDILYRTKGHAEHEFILGPSHEEIVTPLAKKFIKSYRDLPLALYQIQTKFRNEPRAKSGILRGREFGMKDLYSFHKDEKDLDEYYKKVTDAYFKIFQRCGLEAYICEASGGAFTKQFSHEFTVLSPVGEDKILICETCLFSQNAEIAESDKCKNCGKKMKSERGIEAGNIFKLGAKFSKDFNLTYLDENGKENLIMMGCYGIGNTRLIGVIVEASHDENGIIWPMNVSPYKVHLLHLGNESDIISQTEKLYEDLKKHNIEVLYDDRNETAGVKLKDADLIGIPIRILISQKTLEKNCVEWKLRSEKNMQLVKFEEVIGKLKE